MGFEPTVGFRRWLKRPSPSTTRSTGPDSDRGPTQPVPYQTPQTMRARTRSRVALGNLFECIVMEDHFYSPFVLSCWTSYLALIRIGVKGFLAGSGGFEPPTLLQDLLVNSQRHYRSATSQNLVEDVGLEPTTFCLQSRCSPR